MAQTTLPQHPQRTASVNQQVWTVWTMLQYFINAIYDAQIAAIYAAVGKAQQVGSATITAPSKTVVVSHTLGTALFSVVLTPTSANAPDAWGSGSNTWWVSNKTTTSFVINLPAAPASNVSFDWMVRAQ
jgi:hypothetical protein